MAIQRGDLDPALVQRAQDGDGDARERLLAQLQPVLRAFFIRRIGRRTDVDDLVQNTLLRVHGGLGVLKDPSRLKAFAMKAALFELHDLYRGRYGPKESLFDPELPPKSAALPYGTAGAGVDVEKALALLTPRARRILELREYGYRYQEIAEMIGTSEAAVKMQVKRAFDKMRRVLTTLAIAVLTAAGLLA
ncbi:MAG: sigma-70 family RNA polymerase sigma factor [Rhodothermales bacterium]|nr:sigma-70 family RNA polymerase sigma factor [Rhodothermales bacterium]